MEYKNKTIVLGLNTSLSAKNWSPAPANIQTVETNENVISYKNIFNDVDLEYELNINMIQHRLKFNNRNVFSHLSSQEFIDVEEIIELPPEAWIKINEILSARCFRSASPASPSAKGSVFEIDICRTNLSICGTWKGQYKYGK